MTVLCGRGNNGGDGMMTARLLATAGLKVTTMLLGAAGGMAGDAAAAWRELASPAHGFVHVVKTADDLTQYNTALQTDLIVDAVVGTGFKPPLKGMALAALEWIKGSAAPVLAVDLPSGWPADSISATCRRTGLSRRCGDYIYRAQACACVRTTDAAMGPADCGGADRVARCGDCFGARADVGWRVDAMAQTPRACAIRTRANLGMCWWWADSVGKAGAPAMTALAALRTGAGLVTAAVPAPVLRGGLAIAPELMTWPLTATAAGELAAQGTHAGTFAKR